MGPNYVLDKGFIAGNAIGQFRAVVQTGDQTCALAGAAGDVLGVCQEEISAQDATDGRVADIRIMGITRMIAGAAVTRRDRVAADAQGRAVLATTGQAVIGIAWTAATAAGEHIDVLLTPGAKA